MTKEGKSRFRPESTMLDAICAIALRALAVLVILSGCSQLWHHC